MYNKVILMGRIASDISLKTTTNGISVVTFRIAVDRKYQEKNGEKATDFFNIVAWRNTAQFISQYCSKGRMIFIEGELQSREYKDKENNTKYVTEIIVDRVCFTGEKSNNNGANAPAERGENLSNKEATVETIAQEEDDYPF